MNKIIFRYTVESDGENLRVHSEIGDDLDPAEALLVGLFRRYTIKAENTVLAVIRDEDGIILA